MQRSKVPEDGVHVGGGACTRGMQGSSHVRTRTDRYQSRAISFPATCTRQPKSTQSYTHAFQLSHQSGAMASQVQRNLVQWQSGAAAVLWHPSMGSPLSSQEDFKLQRVSLAAQMETLEAKVFAGCTNSTPLTCKR